MTTKPEERAGFTEGNNAEYTVFVPHDPYGLITALGGEAGGGDTPSAAITASIN